MKKKNKKNDKILIFCAILIIILFYTGIFYLGGFNYFFGPTKSEEMIDFVEKKYSEEFIPGKLYRAGFISPCDTLYAYLKSDPEKKIKILRSEDDEGNISYSDTYFCILIKNRYKFYVENIMDKSFKNYKMDLKIEEFGTISNDLNKETNVRNIHDIDKYFSSDIIMFVPKRECSDGKLNQEILDKNLKNMIESNLVFSVRYYLLENEIYDEISKMNEEDRSIWFNKKFKYIDYKEFLVNYKFEIHQFEN